MLLIDEVKKLAGILFKSRSSRPRMIQLSEAEENIDLEMASLKSGEIVSKVRCIMVCAKKNIIYPGVEANHIALGIGIPSPQQLIMTCIDCLDEVCDASGDMIQLRVVENKYRILLKKC